MSCRWVVVVVQIVNFDAIRGIENVVKVTAEEGEEERVLAKDSSIRQPSLLDRGKMSSRGD